MGRDSHFVTYFDKPDVTLEMIEQALAAERPTRDGDWLVVAVPDANATMRIGLSDAPRVAKDAQDAARSKRKPGIAACTRRVEVLCDDVEAMLYDYNTMFEVQERLNKVCGGWTILGWNGNVLFEPEAPEPVSSEPVDPDDIAPAKPAKPPVKSSKKAAKKPPKNAAKKPKAAKKPAKKAARKAAKKPTKKAAKKPKTFVGSVLKSLKTAAKKRAKK